MIELYKSVPPWFLIVIIVFGVLFGGTIITLLFNFSSKVVDRFIKKNDQYWENATSRMDKIDESFDKVNENMSKLISETRLQGYRISHTEREISLLTGKPIVNYKD